MGRGPLGNGARLSASIMDEPIRVALALVPVLLFLAALRWLDRYELVTRRATLTALAAGAAVAALCYTFNTFILQQFPEYQQQYARFGAPVIEELAKAVYWILMIVTARVAFMVDSAICGFAVGAGFALVENVSYLHVLEGRGWGIWLLRGFGTAIMHGGVAALGASVAVYLSESRQWRGARLFAPGLLAAIVLHSLFNLGLLLSPAASMAAALAGLPLILILVFYFSERSLHQWLTGKLDRDINLFHLLQDGESEKSPLGSYLMSLEGRFPPEVCGHMRDLLQLAMELSMRSKGYLILQENGLEVPPDPELDGHLNRLRYLEKSIGPTGMLAIRPLLSQSPRDLWELHRLAEGRRGQ
jgi:RsiW-degrading membrane proteinase PrsW (M82 family)